MSFYYTPNNWIMDKTNPVFSHSLVGVLRRGVMFYMAVVGELPFGKQPAPAIKYAKAILVGLRIDK